MGENIESKVADTILQKSKSVEIGGETFEVAPPTTATLILVSEKISLLPQIEVNKKTDILTETLRIAKDCSFLGDIVSILILGANGLTEKTVVKTEKEIVHKKIFGLIKQKEIITVEADITINKHEELASFLLKHKSPKELNELFADLIVRMEIGDFFGLTTSLLEINLIRPTREVETIVSGQ